MSFFDVKALIAPFVDEARAADQRRRLEYLHVVEIHRRAIAVNLEALGYTTQQAYTLASADLRDALQRATMALQHEERRSG
ncbi:MAG: hypothetical protein ACKVWV_20360 [Planctomycetota bacterium]